MQQGSDLLKMNDTKRVFIAMNLNQEIKKYISMIQEEIKNCVKEDRYLKIRLVESKNLHISLKFLSDLKPLEIEKTLLSLQKISYHDQSFKIDLLKSIGIFPNIKRPRVIWIGIEEGYSTIEIIYNAIEQALMKEHFYRKDKKFTAHITLGRIEYLKGSDKIIECINNVHFRKISQTIHSIELMESNLTSQGPIYTVLKSFPLLPQSNNVQ